MTKIDMLTDVILKKALRDSRELTEDDIKEMRPVIRAELETIFNMFNISENDITPDVIQGVKDGIDVGEFIESQLPYG